MNNASSTQEGRLLGGRYQILEEAGRGGMAVVYKALDVRLRRLVAVKVLYPFLASKPETRRRFEREALLVSRLAHANIVQIYDFSGPDSEDVFIVSEFIEGITLKSFVQGRPPLLPELAAMIVEQVAEALAHAHSQEIVHRDVKPENVMIGGGVVKLTDFGIAHMINFEEMTVTGTLVGSPAFMSPEHIEGRGADLRADVFSLGTLFYYLTTGELPFRGQTAHALLKNILEVRYRPAHEVTPAVGDEVSAIIGKCLRRNPMERFSSCGELCEAVRSHLRRVGLNDDCTGELKRFFVDEQRTEALMRMQVVASLLEQARGLERGGLVVAALKLLDRASFLDDANEEVASELARVTLKAQRRRRWRGLAMGLLTVSAVSLLGVAGYTWIWGDRGLMGRDVREVAPPSEVQRGAQPLLPVKPFPNEVPPFAGHVERAQPPPHVVVGSGPDGTAARQAWAQPGVPLRNRLDLRGPDSQMLMLRSLGSTRRPLLPGSVALFSQSALGETLREKVRRPGETEDGAGQSSDTGNNGTAGGLVTLEAYPPAVEIWVDGRRLGIGKATAEGLAPGPHELSLRHPGCDVCEDRTVTFNVPADAPTHIKERIGFKPAMLTVDAPGDGQVFVAGALLGRVGRPILVQAKTHLPWEVDIKVIFDDGREPANAKVTLQAGQRSVAKAQ